MSPLIPVHIHIEKLDATNGNDTRFTLNLSLIGSDTHLGCDLIVNDDDDPRVTQAGRDDFGLPDDLRDKLVIVLYRFLLHYLLFDMAGPASLVEWSQPDLRPWLDQRLYHQDASRLARLIRAKVDPTVKFSFDRPIISTRHD